MKFPLFIFLIFLTSELFSQVEDIPFKRSSSFEGRHFILGFMKNENTDNSEDYFKIIISSTTKNRVRITTPDGSVITKDIPSNTSYSIDLSAEVGGDFEIQNSGKTNKIFDIKAENPLSVYCYNAFYQMSSDVFTAVPSKYWGNEYFTVNSGNDYYVSDVKGGNVNEVDVRRGEFLVIANEDNTNISFRLEADTDLGNQFDFDLILNKGEAYFVQSDDSRVKGGSDLTGTRIKSDKPIGVISGHMRGSIPPRYSANGDSKDHLVEMLLPTDKCGKKYYTAPWTYDKSGSNHIKSFFKVVATENNTSFRVTYDNKEEIYTINASGGYLFFDNIQSQAEWVADKNIIVAQFMGRDTTALDPSDINVYYDPSYAIITPVERNVNTIIFHTISKNEFGSPIYNNVNGKYVKVSDYQYENHYMYVSANLEAIKTLTLDGVLVETIKPFRKDVGISEFYYTIININEGTHLLHSDEGEFNGVLFGAGIYDSYSQILGSSLLTLNDDIAPEISWKESCGGVRGTIIDSTFDFDSGVGEVSIVEQVNFDFTFTKVDYDSKFIEFRADVQDITQDGILILEYHDFFGNGKRFTYNHLGINLVFQDDESDIDYGTMKLGEVQSQSTYLINNGSSTVTIEYIEFQDPRVTLNNLKFPLKLLPKDTLELNFTFDTQNSSDDLSLLYEVEYDCNSTYLGLLKAKVINPDLIGKDKVFPKTLVKDNKLKYGSFYNKGNTELVLTHVEFEPNPHFTLDTAGLFPFSMIVKNGLIEIPAYYHPQSIGEHSIEVIAYERDNNLIDTIEIRGEGGSPDFQDIIVDFGRIRLGDEKELPFDISNEGSFGSDINFASIRNVHWFKNDNSIPDYIETLNDFYAEDFTTNHNLLFRPTEAGDFSYEVNYQYEYEKDEFTTFSITVLGSAYTGDININEYCSDDQKVQKLKVGKLHKLTYNIVEIIGSESSTINRVVGSSTTFTDINGVSSEIAIIDDPIVFNPDILSYDNNVINNSDNTELDIAIDFTPLKIGNYQKELYIINNSGEFDVNLGYHIDTTSICLDAIPLEPLDFNLEFISTDLQSCIDGQVTARFTNSNVSSLPLTIINIDTNYTGLEAELITDLITPYTVATGEAVDFAFNTNMINGQTGTIELELEILDELNNRTETLKREAELMPVTSKMIIDVVEYDTLSIKDTVYKIFTGEFPTHTDVYTNLSINLNFDEKNFYYINNSIEFYIIDGEGNRTSYSLTPTITNNKMYIEFVEKEFFIEEGSKWYLGFSMLTLYHIERDIDFSLEILSDRCFETAYREIKGEIGEICLFTQRFITLATINKLDNFDNLVNKTLKIAINIEEEIPVNIGIYDILGNYFPIVQNKTFKQGNHFIYYDLNTVNNGNYLLEMKSGINRETKKIIIQK